MADDPPVEPGDTLTATIEDPGRPGRAIARVEDGYVLIVPDATPGEEVLVEVESPVFGSYAFASVISRGEYPQRQCPDEDPQGQELARASSKYEVRTDGPV